MFSPTANQIPMLCSLTCKSIPYHMRASGLHATMPMRKSSSQLISKPRATEPSKIRIKIHVSIFNKSQCLNSSDSINADHSYSDSGAKNDVRMSSLWKFQNRANTGAMNSRPKNCGTIRVPGVQPHSFGTEAMEWRDSEMGCCTLQVIFPVC
jgi:hypothetical protein